MTVFKDLSATTEGGTEFLFSSRAAEHSSCKIRYIRWEEGELEEKLAGSEVFSSQHSGPREVYMQSTPS